MQYGHCTFLGYLESHSGSSRLTGSSRGSAASGWIILIFFWCQNSLSNKKDVEFTLKENGDVEWKFPDTQVGILFQKNHNVSCRFVQERLPLFDCDTFEVLREREGFTVVVLLR